MFLIFVAVVGVYESEDIGTYFSLCRLALSGKVSCPEIPGRLSDDWNNKFSFHTPFPLPPVPKAIPFTDSQHIGFSI